MPYTNLRNKDLKLMQQLRRRPVKSRATVKLLKGQRKRAGSPR